MTTMLNVGDVVQATVTRTEVYGVYLTHQGQEILVLIPDVAWVPTVHDCREFARPGDELDVKILLFNAKEGIFRGSIKDVHPEDDTWHDPSVFQTGTEWTGRVTKQVSASRSDGGLFGYIIEQRPGVSGLLRSEDAGRSLSVGDSVDIIIVEVDSSSKKITLKRSPRS
jgi:ribosomal protein S1